MKAEAISIEHLWSHTPEHTRRSMHHLKGRNFNENSQFPKGHLGQAYCDNLDEGASFILDF
jgi:hypothetical protein